MSEHGFKAAPLVPRPLDPVSMWQGSLKPSQSLLSHLDKCGYAGYLYLRNLEPGSHAMNRGNAFHTFAERATYVLLQRAGVLDDATIERARVMAEAAAEEQGTDPNAMFREFLEEAGVGPARLDPDEARDLMQRVLSENPELNVPVGEQESLRAMAWNFATGHVIDPHAVVAVETMFELELDGWIIRGKIDRAEIHDDTAYVHDYKTSRLNMKAERDVASQEKYEQAFQPPFYALGLSEGVYAHPTERHPQRFVDPAQYGERIAKGLAAVNTLEHYPRYTHEQTGELVARFATWDRAKLADFKEGLRALLRKLEHGLVTGRWAATPSEHCDICPMETECPIKPRHRKRTPRPRTEDEARALAGRIILAEKSLGRDRKALRAFVNDNGELSVEVDGDTYDYDIRKVEQQRDDRTIVSTRFDKKKVAA